MPPTMTTPTFIAHPLPVTHAAGLSSSQKCPRRHTVCPRASAEEKAIRTTDRPESAPDAPSKRDAPQRARARAPVVDSRVDGVAEAHHWIVVKSSGSRMFERAAIANANVTRVVENRSGSGALHRWLLRRAPDPCLGFPDGTFVTESATYVVMETFPVAQSDAVELTQRWLSAVKRAGPALGALDIRTMHYRNVFTAKSHGAKFTAEDGCVVVVESVNVDMSRGANLAEMYEILRSGAEASVNSGECMEFCVLQANDQPQFFKTIEVYKNVDALRRHMDGFDRAFLRRSQGRTIGEHRSRQTFTPILFS